MHIINSRQNIALDPSRFLVAQIFRRPEFRRRSLNNSGPQIMADKAVVVNESINDGVRILPTTTGLLG